MASDVYVFGFTISLIPSLPNSLLSYPYLYFRGTLHSPTITITHASMIALAGASATIASDALMNPFDGELSFLTFPDFRPPKPILLTVIKQRMQVHQSEFRSVFTAIRVVYHNEGASAFYVSYPTTLMMSVPFTAVQFTVYEQIKKVLNPKGEYSPVSHMIAGGMAGGVAAGVTTPLDVAKTLLQTRGTSQDPEIRRVSGMMDAFRVIWKRDGVKGFGRGMSPRVLTHMPSNALCWLSYEFFSELPVLVDCSVANASYRSCYT